MPKSPQIVAIGLLTQGDLDALGQGFDRAFPLDDELVFEAPEAEAEAVIAVARQVMERAPEPAVSISVPLVVDARAAPNWDDAH